MSKFEGCFEAEEIFVVAFFAAQFPTAFETVLGFHDKIRTEAVPQSKAKAPQFSGWRSEEEIIYQTVADQRVSTGAEDFAEASARIKLPGEIVNAFNGVKVKVTAIL